MYLSESVMEVSLIKTFHEENQNQAQIPSLAVFKAKQGVGFGITQTTGARWMILATNRSF
jgi:hypothetical protein